MKDEPKLPSQIVSQLGSQPASQIGPQLDPKRVLAIKPPKQLATAPEGRQLSKYERAFFSAQTEGLRQDIQERKKYASRIFVLCGIWIAAVFLLLTAQGLSRWTSFNLPQPVLLAAIGSTTANIIAVFLIVARYLFPGKDR